MPLWTNKRKNTRTRRRKTKKSRGGNISAQLTITPLIQYFKKKNPNPVKKISINDVDKSSSGKITYVDVVSKKEKTIQFKNLDWWLYKYVDIDTKTNTVAIHSCKKRYCFSFNNLTEQQKFISLVDPSKNAAAFNYSVQ